MNPTRVIHHKAYRLGASYPLTEPHLGQLVKLFQSPDQTSGETLGGRRCVSKTHLPGIGPVVVKHYRRGGLTARFIKTRYLKVGATRGQVEFEQMRAANSIGVNTPAPVAYAYRGFLVYRAWLVTKEIEGARSLAQISLTDPRQAADAMAGLIPQIRRMIGHGILHADFHPGNILVDGRGRVYLIDFDKARSFKGGKERLRGILLRRWQRAVEKYGLPPMLHEKLQRHI